MYAKLYIAIVFLLLGCNQITGDIESRKGAGRPDVKITGFAITSEADSLPADSSMQLTLTATLSDESSQDLTDKAAWTSSDEEVATFVNDEETAGLLTGVAIGSVTVTADVNGQQATLTLEVTESTDETQKPTVAAKSITFTDTDANVAEIGGNVIITKAGDESNIDSYMIYWGSDATTKQSTDAIATIAKTGENLSYAIKADTDIPAGPPAATHLLVFTSNTAGEMETGVAVAIDDLGLPRNAAEGLSFTDSDVDTGEVAGTVTITKAEDESDVTDYVLYWGSDDATKQSTTPLATIPVTGSDVTHTFAADTAIPTSPEATHLLVFTKNAEGEMATGISEAIVDAGPPSKSATSITFTDTDLDDAEIAGTATIAKASDEAEITHYVLYWGSDASTKQSATPIATIAKSGANVSHVLASDTAIPGGATHLLVYTKNTYGEMASGVATAITDLAAPTNAATGVSFTDTDLDGGELQGTVTITKAGDESDLTDYVLYWGSDASTKQSDTPIATVAKTGANVTHTFAANTAIPSSPAATHLLVFTKNSDGEMATGVSAAITDLAVPTTTAAGITFTDSDTDGGEIAGTATIAKAASEANITHYVLYWGSDATTKQDGTPIDTIAVTGSDVTHIFAADTAIPTGPDATHLLVFTKNADGEMATGISLAITDSGVPTAAASGVSFTDTDTDKDELGGTVAITKAANENNITHYMLYWGSDASTKQNATPIATIAKTGSDLTYAMAADTAIPNTPTATHLLVFTKNADGEMASGVSVAITDVAVPTNAAVGVSFTDSDSDGGEVQGTVTITKAGDESDLTHYVLYWGSDASTKQSATPIADIAKTGSDVTHTFAADTAIPSSPAATHLLVFTKNADGEMATGVSTAITDVAIPTVAATSVAFTDTDSDSGEIAGTVTITKASSEADISHYVLYWGSDATTKQNGSAIDTIAVTGSDVTHTFGADTAIPTGPDATHLLVFTKNDDGEMATGVSVAITDLGIPTNAAGGVAFTDTDGDEDEIGGTVTITKAANEASITHYVLYWGSDASTKQNATPIDTIAKTGSNVTHVFAADTAIPSTPAATHLLVFTMNADGEMATGVSVAIDDIVLPIHAPTSVSFTDTDLDGGYIGGDINIGKASDESDVTDYVIYWGSDASTKQNATPIDTVSKTGSNLTYNLSANTAIPSSPAATHLLVFTKNADGEMATGVAVAITDLGVPTNAATSMSFTDTDLDGGEIGGTVNITKASDESDLTGYVLYWGSNSTTKQNATPITTITKTGSNLSYNVSADTAVPLSPDATHLLVFTENDDGEMATGVSVAINDLGVPVNAATSMSFTDTDLDGGEIGGTVNITKASDESDITDYVLYWGSNSTTKQSGTAIVSVTATGSNLTYNMPADTVIPTSPAATHLLVFTTNNDGEMATGVSVAITDLGVPTNAATSMSFTDGDSDGGEVSGTVTITKASDESDLTHYVLYWGSNSTTKQSGTPIASLAKTGANVTHTFAADTPIPSSPAATHLLVFTKNADGEMATGVSTAITDVGVPSNAAASVTFTDADLDGGEISGTVTISKATDESDVTHYVLYWGSDGSTKQSGTPITTIAKTGANVTYSVPADTTLPSGPAATHFLVFTKNADGEMATGVNVAITDLGVPTNAAGGVSFTDGDLDGGEISGTLTITKATDESDLSHYVLYWGSDSSTKQSGTPISSIAKTGSDVTHVFSANTAVPSSPAATHLLVFTKNDDGEMATGVNVAITDLGVPTNAADSLAFTDTDLDGGQVSGTVNITKASDESDLTHYVLYWGSNSTTKQSGTPITTLAKTGSDLTHAISANTALPSSPAATHLLVFTKNADGEMATGVNVAIDDLGVPTNAAAGIAFTDGDTDADEISGTLTITKATDESDVTHYVLYWGSNATTKQSGTPIETIAKTGANVTSTFAANTAIPSSPAATHFLVYTKNADGEMSTPTAIAIVDDDSPPQRVFVTSTTYNGSQGGLAGVDAICQARADAAGLSGTWIALLSDASTNAKDRVTISGAVYDIAGNTIATSSADMWDGSIGHTLNIDEFGNDVGNISVWTASKDDGTKYGTSPWQSCNSWTSTADNGNLGSTGSTTDWMESPGSYAAGTSSKPFFCISQ